MKALVTGANGFLGRAVVSRLLARGRSLRLLVRRRSHEDDLRRLFSSDEDVSIECTVGDLRAPETLRGKLYGIDVVYHLAATMKGSFADNVVGTVVGSRNLLDTLREESPGARIVLVSSFAVYGTAGLPRGSVVDERTPLEPRPELRGGYCYAKLRQERLVRDYSETTGAPLVVMRPGVVYGPGGGAFSPRVGVQLPGVFLHLGNGNEVPFTYVDNCAEAIACAGEDASLGGRTFNVVDDDLWTSRRYLRAYRRRVSPIRYVSVPFRAMRVLAGAVEGYHRFSKGQMPAFFTRYKTDTNWRGTVFTNRALKSAGWSPLVSTSEGMQRTFEWLRGHAPS